MSTTATSSQVREAARSGQTLRIVAGAGWLDAGRPVRADATLSVAADRGIVEYVPGDLTLTARAGTPIADLVTAVKTNDQWLPLDPWGVEGDGGTLGATISTATAGPHSHAMGLPRDVVLGMEFVSGSGDVIRAGGRVVKNVAGFDLTRLLIGSWGTLGVITEVTVRLRARPALLRSFVIEIQESGVALNRLSTSLRSLPFTPIAAEVVNAELSHKLGVGTSATLITRVGGNANSVSAQIAALSALGSIREAPPDIWQRLRECDTDAEASWRCSQLPSAFGDTWTEALQATGQLESTLVHGSPFRGVVRVLAKGEARALGKAVATAGTIAIEKMPAAVFPAIPAAKGKNEVLAQRIRTTFDPRKVLNPGIMGADA